MFSDINSWTASAACSIRENIEMANRLEGLGNQMSLLVEAFNDGLASNCAKSVRRNDLDPSAGSLHAGPQPNNLGRTG